MSLNPGSRLGPYEITGAIGAGGMGEVFRARDTKLNRDVAIKVLPAAFADDPERLARFTREAQTLASLNHPNIGAIYGIEEIASSGSSAGLVAMTEGASSGDLVAMTKGVAPSAKALAGEKGIINARSESVAEKPMFRAAFRRQRCLVPANGYYEWQSAGGRKQPWYIRPADAPLFGFAGIYTLHRGECGEVGTVAILTTGASASTRAIHERMPAILRPEVYDRWLDPAAEPASLLPLLGPCSPERVAPHPVSPRVNSVRNDDESCIVPEATIF